MTLKHKRYNGQHSDSVETSQLKTKSYSMADPENFELGKTCTWHITIISVGGLYKNGYLGALQHRLGASSRSKGGGG